MYDRWRVLTFQQQIFDDFERQLDRSRARADKLEAELASANSVNLFFTSRSSGRTNTKEHPKQQLQAIRAEREDFPLSDLDLLHRHQTQIEVFEAIQEALTCPVCYETYSRFVRSISLLSVRWVGADRDLLNVGTPA